MPVPIHGKQYMTVAERVNEFRVRHPMFTIETQLIQNDESFVVMKALIMEGEQLLSTGYAEERRNSTQINKTSALENCETSAIGRALAAFGLGGTEYASANEVENAIAQQEKPLIDSTKKPRQNYINRAVEVYREEVTADKDEPDYQRMKDVNDKLTNDERIAVMDAFGKEKCPGTNRMIKNIVKDCLNWHPADNEILTDEEAAA